MFLGRIVSLFNRHNWLYYIVLLLFAIACYWEVALLRYPMKYDMLTYYYPYRHYVSECLRAGHLPLWCPYQFLGYPIHADPQSGAWYPVFWILSLLGTYSMNAFNLEFTLHIFIAGLAMFKLAKSFGMRPSTGLFMALGYMGCGFFVSNAEHLTYIISGAWLPFILAYFILVLREQQTTQAVWLGICAALLVLGGYPAFAFIFLYFLIAVYIITFIQNAIRNELAINWKITKALLLSLFICLLLAAPSIVSFYETTGLLTRSGGVSVEDALFGGFTPQCLISLLLPYSISKGPAIFNTDLSMANGYVGLLVLAFSFIGLYYKKSWIINGLLVFGVLCLFAAFGSYTPFRLWLYNYVPLMNLFRLPGLFRLFFLISIIVLAGVGFNGFFQKPNKTRAIVSILVVFSLFIAILGLALGKMPANWQGLLTGKTGVYAYLDKLKLSEAICLNVVQQLILLAVLLLIYRLFIKSRFIKLFTIAALCADLFIAAQLNGAESVFTIIPQAEILQIINQQPKGFPAPARVPVSTFTDDGRAMGPFWKNTSIIRKEPGFWGYNPFKLNTYVGFATYHPHRYNQLIARPAVFLTASHYSYLDSMKAFNDSTNNALLFNVAENNLLKGISMQHALKDTFAIKAFGPNHFTIKVQSQSPQLLCVLQNYYPGWEAHINGTVSTIYKAEDCFLTVQVPKGLSEIVLEYKPIAIYIAFSASFITWLLIFGYLLWFCKRTMVLKP